MTFVGCGALKCVSMSDQECKVRPAIININSNESLFYPYSVLVNKCSGSNNKINNPYAKLCVPKIVKDMNIKVFNLMSRTNEIHHTLWHETCAYNCRLDESACNDKKCWNSNKCTCEYKELTNKGRCDDRFIWNPSTCECKCDKLCDLAEYLDYANCKCRGRLIDKLIDEYNENIDGNEMVCNATLYDYGKVNKSCTRYMVLLIIMFIIIMGISGTCFDFYWHTIKNCFNTLTY